MKFNRKIEILFSKEDEFSLDGQSKICNWLYNHLLDVIDNDKKKHNGKTELLHGYNLRDYAVSIKEDYPFLKSVHSSPIKNTALRLNDAFERFFKKQNDYPKFRAWKKKWFSLYFDEANKGVKLLENHKVRIALGNRHYIYGTLTENWNLRKTDKIQNFRLCKENSGRFFLIATINRGEIKPLKKKDCKTWLSIDPNHKNFFTAINQDGETVEFQKLNHLKYWDKQIHDLKSKRDKCKRKAKKRTTYESKNTYYEPSKRWKRLNKALDKAYHCRREQTKSALYGISNWIAKEYDFVAIGDYTPSLDTARYQTMHRSMLNQEVIGQFRTILKWVMQRSGKLYEKIDETNTTKECCMCGHLEKKEPSVRQFTCISCGDTISRDTNSAVNIGKKAKVIKKKQLNMWKSTLQKPQQLLVWNRKTNVLQNI